MAGKALSLASTTLVLACSLHLEAGRVGSSSPAVENRGKRSSFWNKIDRICGVMQAANLIMVVALLSRAQPENR
jgi:hypothetical protein